MKKKDYQAPTLERLGNFESLTRGASRGNRFDADFANDAPVPFDDQGRPIIFS